MSNVPILIWRRWEAEQLPKGLLDLESWEQDRDRHGIGSTALAFDGRNWVVLVSEDLIKRELPF